MRPSATETARRGATVPGPTEPRDRDPLADRLADARQALADGIAAQRPPRRLIAGHARALDRIVRAAWTEVGPPGALFATGGYGRSELYPASDIDLAVLLPKSPSPAMRRRLESFVQRLWDLGLKVGAGVRTLQETREAAAGDAVTFTALCEARLLAGDPQLAERLATLLTEPGLWPLPDYLDAKRRERRERYARYDNSPQRLEPSVKEGPGGLRDLATLCWLGARRLARLRAELGDLESAGLITAAERRALDRSGRVLARVRLALHRLSGRAEERLLFDLQPRVAELLGYRPRRGVLAVEAMMQDYYRAARIVARSCGLLFNSLEEVPAPPRFLAPGLVQRGTAIDFEHPEGPGKDLHQVFSIFSRWQNEPQLTALAPAADRAIAETLPRLDAHFRTDPENRAEFASILGGATRVSATLRAMHDTGVLDRYIPAFARISGRMQYDLFHLFTVDEHILRTLANAEGLRCGRFSPAQPELRTAAERIDRPEALYLAALFHDIAKGRGGDHSTLGAREARRFAREHGLGAADSDLVVWLVQHHLSLSLTAQKSDLSDPRVIASFARRVGDQRRLDYLYVLTAADVRATNPALWNAWRGALFAELYRATSQALWRGLEQPVDAAAEIAARKRDARALLGAATPAVTRFWNTLGNDYFLQYSAGEIAWHANTLAASPRPPVVLARPAANDAGTVVAVYCSRRTFAFARVTTALAQLGLAIVAARCVPVGTAETLDTYIVVEADGSAIGDPLRRERVQALLMEELTRETPTLRRAIRPTPRQVRLFPTPTRIEFAADPDGRYTMLELHAGDRPGLLAAVGRAFKRCDIYLRMAKIMTVGERAEDVFHITSLSGLQLNDDRRAQLAASLREEIADED